MPPPLNSTPDHSSRQRSERFRIERVHLEPAHARHMLAARVPLLNGQLDPLQRALRIV